MEPIRGVLDERFFEMASDECLDALAALIDDALAIRLQAFVQDAGEGNKAACIIKEKLGEALKIATFHVTLLNRGSCKVIEKLVLETAADMRLDRDAIIKELQFLQDNLKYVRSYIPPRTKEDYMRFLETMPREYSGRVKDNQVMFYQQRARARSTGVGIILQRRDTWMIILKGLMFRKYWASTGYALDGYRAKEF